MEQERQESEAAVQAERTATTAALLRGSETAAVAGQASEAGEYSTSAIQKANLGTEGESETTVEEERDATVDEQASETEGVFISEMKQLNLELVEDNRVTEEEWQKKSRSASMAEKTRTFEAEASPENLETTAVRAIQGETKVEASQKPEPEAEEKERVAAETERASSTVAIERFSLKLTHHGGRDFIGEPPNLDFPLMVRGSFQRPPPTPPDKAVRLLRERGSSEWSRRPASKLLDPYPCRSPEGKQPPPEPPDLSVGYSEVFPLLIGQAVREGKTHRRLGWRCTERAEVKAWINNPNGPSPNLSWKALGHAGDWAQIRKGIHGDNLEAENQMTWANEYVTNQTRPCALELGLCRDINTATEARISEKMVVELKVFINTVDENRKRGWPNTSHMAELLKRRLSYKLEWYSVPELLFHWQTSAWSCNPHVLADLVTGYQSLNSQISEFNVWVWRHQHIGDSWTFTQFGSLGGGFFVGADSLTGLLVNWL